MELLDELSNQELKRLTGVHITSIRRWRRLKKMPVHICKLLEFVAQHKIDQLGWTGWTIRNGTLNSPNGELCVTPGQVLAMQIRAEQLAHYQTLERQEKEKIAAGTEQAKQGERMRAIFDAARRQLAAEMELKELTGDNSEHPRNERWEELNELHKPHKTAGELARAARIKKTR